MLRFVGWVVAAVQVRPPSVERNTPAPLIPANRVVPLAARAAQVPSPGSPEVCDHCACVPPGPVSVLLVPQPVSPAVNNTGNMNESRFTETSQNSQPARTADGGPAAPNA